MATKDEILVPETLLKKRKAQAKSREKAIELFEKRKKVGPTKLLYSYGAGDDNTEHATRPWVNAVAISYHLSGLSEGDEPIFLRALCLGTSC